MLYYGANRKTYTLDDIPIKKGGEGAIHTVSGKSNLLAKIYLAPAKSPELKEKISLMVKNPPRQDILDQIAWPIDILSDVGGNFVGFVMPKLSIDVELGDVYKYPAKKKVTLTGEQKVIIAINICRVISAIHDLDYVFGDFNPCNIGVNLKNGHVAFLDTDSYHITDTARGKTYRCNVCLNGYVAPELIKKCKNMGYAQAPLPTFTKETDLFSLAIHIFKLLMNGFTPYNGIPENERSSTASPGVGNAAIEMDHYCFKAGNRPLSVAVLPLQSFPNDVQRLFTRAFDEGHRNPSKRPTAKEWDAVLTNYHSNLKRCSANPMHHHYKGLQTCPYCEADQRYNFTMSISSVYGTSSGSPSSGQMSFSTPMTPPPTPPSGSSSYTNSSYNPSGSGQYSGTVLSGGGSSTRVSQRNTNGFVRKLTKWLIGSGATIAAIFLIFVAICFVQVNNVKQQIDALPSNNINYERSGEQIVEAYNAYDNLNSNLKGFVSNSDYLYSVMNGYDTYMLEVMRSTMAEVNEQSVQETDILNQVININSKVLDTQRNQLTSAELNSWEDIVCIAQTVNMIDTLLENITEKYDTLSSITSNYSSLSTDQKALVYNYSKLDGVEEKYNLLQGLVCNGGAISVNSEYASKLSGEIVIPETMNGQKVTSIPEKGFANCSNITSIVVPDSVTSIGYSAFAGCSRINSISLPFVGASRTATGAKGLIGYIFGESSYSGGTKITQYYDSGSYDREYYYIPGQLKKVTVTDATQLSYGAFYNCSMLSEITLCDSIIGVGSQVFRNCEGITNINLPNISAISSSMCEGCASLQSFNINSNVTTIGSYAFKGCISLSRINSNVEGTFVIGPQIQSIGFEAFNGCLKLQSITLPFVGESRTASGAKGLFGYIFGEESYSGGTKTTQYYGSGSYDREYYYIPTSLKHVIIQQASKLSYGAFYNCSTLSSITINSNAKGNIGSKAFNNCVEPTYN